MSMYCNQCQEAAGGKACTIKGVCGKTEDVANLQDLLIYTLQLLATEIVLNKTEVSKDINELFTKSLFQTITNANFNRAEIIKSIRNVLNLLNHSLKNSSDIELEEFSKTIGFETIKDADTRALKSLIIFGLKGIAAYLQHANNLNFYNENTTLFLITALKKVHQENITVEELISLTLETGKYGVEAMALLDKANTSCFGNPEITEVNIGVRNNPAILVSGHDLKDFEELLEQSKNSGVDIYTHSEMLPANYYPGFKKYSHFVGNYGNAWWKQAEEFEKFNGAILLTTNCLIPPKDSYKNRLYTTGEVGFEGVTHIADRENGKAKDFSKIIEQAKTLPSPTEIEKGSIVGGFAHHQTLALADKVIDAVKSGAIKKFIVMAGCDGRMKSRDYYTEFAKGLSNDTVILTAGCAKYRYNKLNLGDIGGIPRVLDAGQCNDSYSLAVTALKLKEVFGLDDINDLPIVYNIAWYEQKAVIVLLALLSLGVKNIHLGPTLPAFLSPNVIDVLVKNFQIGGVTNPKDDLISMLA
jgi:hydroxylamine reductase